MIGEEGWNVDDLDYLLSFICWPCFVATCADVVRVAPICGLIYHLKV